jgi:hypothetical protein
VEPARGEPIRVLTGIEQSGDDGRVPVPGGKRESCVPVACD